MKTLNFNRRSRTGHLLRQGRASTLDRILRFTDNLQQAISNFELLGLVTGTVANVTLLLSLLHHQTAINGQKGVI